VIPATILGISVGITPMTSGRTADEVAVGIAGGMTPPEYGGAAGAGAFVAGTVGVAVITGTIGGGVVGVFVAVAV
jgi:hypothetical protein